MYLNSKIRYHIYNLSDIERDNRRKFDACEPFVLYQLMIDYCRYWRKLEAANFNGLDFDSVSELYSKFNLTLREAFSTRLDLYWLIQGYDGKPLLQDGRQIELFWQRKYTKTTNW